MNFTLSSFIAFTAGAAIGSLIAWKISKKRYEKLMQEETEELREYYTGKLERLEGDLDEYVNEWNEAEEEYERKLSKLGYTDYSGMGDDRDNDREVDDIYRPYVIMPEEFGNNMDYEMVSLTYYADGVLADELDNIIEDVDDTIGEDSLNHFGQYEDDSVFVRNDRLECDYEILRDERRYVDVAGPIDPLGVD